MTCCCAGSLLEVPLLPVDEVQVWVWRCPPYPAQATYHDLLSVQERRRAARFVFDHDRARYITAHAGLRLVLGGLLGISGADIALVDDLNGKPRLDCGNHRPPLYFNLSHSHDLAALAVSASFEVGLDIELLRAADLSGVVSMFSDSEQAALSRLPQEQRMEAAFTAWTRKEAFVKATGLGLNTALDSFDVSLEPDAPARLLGVAGLPDEADAWQLTHLVPAPGYIGAVAARALGWRVVLNEFLILS